MAKFDPDYEPRLADHGGDMSKRWYIDYRIWNTDKNMFVRKQYTGMNKFKSYTARRKAAAKKLAEIKQLILEGFTAGKKDPLLFDVHNKVLSEAFEFVISSKRGDTSDDTLDNYSTVVNRLKGKPINSKPFSLITTSDVFLFMEDQCKSRGNKTYNNYLNLISSVFNFFIRLELLQKNPCRSLSRKRVEPSERHYPYTDEQRKKIKEKILEMGDHQLLLFISFIYYTFTRNGKELRMLRVRDIKEKTIFIPSDRSKNDKGEHIPIPQGLEQLIQRYKLRSYPPDYYVFTLKNEPGETPTGVNYFYKRHKAILTKLKMTDQHYTVYSYKHTGAINLYNATLDIELVRRHCRHHHAAQTATYLRKLGVLRDYDNLDKFPDF
jgi:hypothetical protein